jgi:uncharacterized damage-inducible protein DinB
MTNSDLVEWMEFARKRTLNLLAALAKEEQAQTILGWRPGPGRAHIAWQLMHIGATDDRHLNARMKGGQPKEPAYVDRYAGGSTPDDDIPTLEEIRRYITESRDAILNHLRSLDDSQLPEKPNEQAQWNYQEWFEVLAWHEAHHQGQAHLTLNLFKAGTKQ